MADNPTCPEPGQLESLLFGSLTEAEQGELSRHIEGCRSCQDALEQLARTSWADRAADLARNLPPADSVLQQVLQKALQSGPASAETLADPAPGSGGQHLPYLQPSANAGSLGRLGHYDVLEVIGKGGFGTVLRAFDEKLRRVVAIKVLAPELAASGTARQRFIREAHAAAAIKNDHVVAIYSVEPDHQPPYLVMEMIDGLSLQDLLDRDGPLGLKEILRIGMQAAEGLAAAHKQGLIHRDIKPSNILLENGVQRVKISDFGLARAVDDASVTQSGVIAGTPLYMSPEQAAGERLDHRSDLFSLGSVLYAMCTGRPPFRASGTMAVLKRVCEETPRPVCEVNPEIPDWLAAIISRLHAKQPEGRYQTAREVADLLGQHLAHLQQPHLVPRPAGAEPPPAADAAARPYWRLIPWPVAVGLLILAAYPLIWLCIALGLYSREVMGTADLSFALACWYWLGLTAVAVVQRRRGTPWRETWPLRAAPWPAALDTVAHRLFPPDRWRRRLRWQIPLVLAVFSAAVVFTVLGNRHRDRIRTAQVEITWEPGLTVELDGGPNNFHTWPPPQVSVHRILPQGLYSIRGWKGGVMVYERQVLIDSTHYTHHVYGPPPAGWVRLFNEKDLTGWEGAAGKYLVSATGALLANPVPNESGMLRTVKSYENYELRLECLLSGRQQVGSKIRGGVALHVKDVEGLAHPKFALAFSLTSGPEPDLLVHHSGDVGKIQQFGKTRRPTDSWNELRVVCQGQKVTAFYNGEVRWSCDRCPQGPGSIGLWALEGPVWFRKIDLKELPPEVPGWVQLFNGKDLKGWIIPQGSPGVWKVENRHLIGREQADLHTDRLNFRDFHLRIEAKYVRGEALLWLREQADILRSGYTVYMNNKKGDLHTGAMSSSDNDASGWVEEERTRPDVWFTLEVIAKGKHFQTFVNGEKALDFVGTRRDISAEGPIRFHVLGELHVRKIEIKELPPTQAAGK